MDIRKLVAINIRKHRVALGLSQEALAVDAEIDRTHISRIERGVENPTILVLERIAGALGCEIANLFERPKVGEKLPETLPKGRKKGR
jgi:Predicted transcriptional regulators